MRGLENCACCLSHWGAGLLACACLLTFLSCADLSLSRASSGGQPGRGQFPPPEFPFDDLGLGPDGGNSTGKPNTGTGEPPGPIQSSSPDPVRIELDETSQQQILAQFSAFEIARLGELQWGGYVLPPEDKCGRQVLISEARASLSFEEGNSVIKNGNSLLVISPTPTLSLQVAGLLLDINGEVCLDFPDFVDSNITLANALYEKDLLGFSFGKPAFSFDGVELPDHYFDIINDALLTDYEFSGSF